MDKWLLLIGIALILAAFVWSSASVRPLPALNSTYSSTVAVAGNSFTEGTTTMSNGTMLLFSYTAQSPLDFYLFNSSSANYLNASKLQLLPGELASNVITAGLLDAALNNRNATIPYLANASLQNSQPSTANSLYYFVLSNPSPSATNVTYFYTVVPVSALSGASLQTSLGTNVVPSIMFIAGIVIAVFSVFRPKGGKKTEATDAEVQKTYAQLEKKRRSSDGKHKKQTR